MLRETLTSAPLPYRDHNDLPAYTGFGPYYPYLVEPPRHYREEIQAVSGLFAKREQTATADYTINAVIILRTYEWPSWQIIQARWDAATGAYIDRIDRSTLGVTLRAIKAGADDSLWAQYSSNALRLVDPTTWALMDTTYTTDHFGVTTITAYGIDRARDMAVLRTNQQPNDGVGIYRLSTGELLDSMQVAGQVQDIFLEENGRAYVLATNGVLTLIDYVSPRVISVMRQRPQTGSRSTRFAWDRQYRRVLAIDATPEESDGASTTRVRGYYPAAAAVALTRPIPLQAPRVGRTVQMLTRAYGDTGEPIAGLRIDAGLGGSPSPDADVAPAITSADGYGYARHWLTCTAEEAIDFEVSATS